MKLTIVDKQRGEPVLVLEQTDSGIQIVGGDPKVADALRLTQFRDLKEIADYINHENSNLQAIADEDGSGPEQDQGPAKLDDRIGPALQILKKLLSQVEQRQTDERSMKEAGNLGPAMEGGAQVVSEKPYPIYVSVDGDNIGNAVARAEEKDDEEALAQVSQRINAGQKVLEDFALKFNGKVIEAGGDEGLVRVPSTAYDHIEDLRQAYLGAVGATCTIGVGRKISESTKARMLGKLQGKDRVVVYDETTPKQLDLLLQDKETTEANKMRTAMRGPDAAGESLRDGVQYNNESQPADAQSRAGVPEREREDPYEQGNRPTSGQIADDEGPVQLQLEQGSGGGDGAGAQEAAQGVRPWPNLDGLPEEEDPALEEGPEAGAEATPEEMDQAQAQAQEGQSETGVGDEAGEPASQEPQEPAAQVTDAVGRETSGSGISPQLIKALREMRHGRDVPSGTKDYDPEIEEQDYSDFETDPMVLKKFRYLMRYAQ